MGIYSKEYYAAIGPGARNSAAVIVPTLMEALRPSSVVDVGCGTGAWLAAFRAAGVEDVLGIDGDYVDRASLDIPVENFQAADLDQPLRIDRSFDLAVCLEVAEHLVPTRSEGFIDDLVRLAPAVFFGAAIPFQGGEHHVNERWQDEWSAIFASHDYRAVDLIRSSVWDNPDVMPWYAQNTLLYVAADIPLEGNHLPLRLVHPAHYLLRLTELTNALRNPPPLGTRQLIREGGRTLYALMKRARQTMRR